MKTGRIITVVALVLLLPILEYFTGNPVNKGDTNEVNNDQIIIAYEKKQNNVLVTGSGSIIKILADDLKGSRHQRLIVRLNAKMTVLIAHNIDIAPRLEDIQRGDHITFRGEYEYNKKGGVIHWTHHAPAGNHSDGWLKHKDLIYQ